jgi:Flp pilus assembly protein TadG
MLNFVSAKLGCRGALSLEFALVALPFVSLLLGGIETGRYLYTVQALSNYAEATLRAAVVHVGDDLANRCLADLSSAFTQPAVPPGLQAARLTRARPSCSRNATSRVVTISVVTTYRFSFAVTLFGLVDQEIRRQAQQTL